MSGRARSHPDAWVQLPPSELVATVQLHPAPHIPLASVRDLLRPVHDEDGRLVDWWLFASGFERPDAVAEYWAWRNTWRRHWPIGPVSNLATLQVEVGRIDHDLDRRLEVLLADAIAAEGRPVVVPVEHASGLLAELETIRLAISVDDRTGAGIVDDMPARTRTSGLLRTWVTPAVGEREVVLAGTPSTTVVLRPGTGLTVTTTAPPATRDESHVRPFGAVQAVDLRGDTVIVLDDRGRSLRLDQQDARPLGWLAPRSLRWHVREVPLVLVWAMVFDGLGAALRAAIDVGEPVVITGEAGVA